MKPTQQEIIDLAREAGGGLSAIAEPLNHPWKFSQTELERFVALLLERYGAGAGGGEPIGYVRPEVIDLLGRGVRCGGERLSPRADEEDGLTAPICTHPSTTDLQSVRDRALDDAAAICRTYDCSPRMAAAEIEALKGKQ